MNKFGETAPKIGFLHVFEKAEFMVRRWDQSKEEISSERRILCYLLNSFVIIYFIYTTIIL